MTWICPQHHATVEAIRRLKQYFALSEEEAVGLQRAELPQILRDIQQTYNHAQYCGLGCKTEYNKLQAETGEV